MLSLLSLCFKEHDNHLLSLVASGTPGRTWLLEEPMRSKVSSGMAGLALGVRPLGLGVWDLISSEKGPKREIRGKDKTSSSATPSLSPKPWIVVTTTIVYWV